MKWYWAGLYWLYYLRLLYRTIYITHSTLNTRNGRNSIYIFRTWHEGYYEPLIDIQTFFCRDTFLFPTCIGVNGDIYFWATWNDGPVHSPLKQVQYQAWPLSTVGFRKIALFLGAWPWAWLGSDGLYRKWRDFATLQLHSYTIGK